MPRMVSTSTQIPRDPANKPTDIAAVRKIAQAAIDVEMFTIPLYMVSLYSIYGMHQITDSGSNLYQGRLWPGAATTANPGNATEIAYNTIFSVFIQEMLHLQMAANMATAVGVEPSFTSTALQESNYAWTCYGPGKTAIPNIVDLKDTASEDLAVDIGPLDEARVDLFIAIEQPEAAARAAIKPDKWSNYWVSNPENVPIAGWAPPQPLPMFGTIGAMYDCYWAYLNLQYSDGSTLWEAVFDPTCVTTDQQDHFNDPDAYPKPQYTAFSLKIDSSDPAAALAEMAAMMDAITDQGEGSLVDAQAPLPPEVMDKYQPSRPNLEVDFPSYDDQGTQLPCSADAAARCDNDVVDHYQRFLQIKAILPNVNTWATMKKAGNWSPADLKASDYNPDAPSKLPTPEDVANALNELADPDNFDKSYHAFNQAVIGCIAGVNRVLNDYWARGSKTKFPGPAMGGSGDRTAILWAVMGKAPDLSVGLDPPPSATLLHSCQALDFNTGGTNTCAIPEAFHNCIGSNLCKAQGGCGFAQSLSGGGGCSGVNQPACGAATAQTGGCGAPAGPKGVCGAPTAYSAPADNKCGGFGGCAVPISASQLYPMGPGIEERLMEVFDFVSDGNGGWTPVPVKQITFSPGQPVAEVAYQAFAAVMEHRGQPVPEPQPPSALRLAFPPST